jgi:hypothetical protein
VVVREAASPSPGVIEPVAASITCRALHVPEDAAVDDEALEPQDVVDESLLANSRAQAVQRAHALDDLGLVPLRPLLHQRVDLLHQLVHLRWTEQIVQHFQQLHQDYNGRGAS